MKPIIFNTDMVNAILDEHKTMARIVVKFPKGLTGSYQVGKAGDNNNPLGIIYPCGITRPKYEIGDILYVRETWTTWNMEYEYKADVDDGYGPFCTSCVREICTGGCNDILKWHPSIHMPKEAARIFLRVTDVRAERLQCMTGEDIKKEGIEFNPIHAMASFAAFQKIWDSHIKPKDRALYGWEANPWVWVIEFERISKDEAQV